ncbi:MAG TPA: pantoate--beta-alanine ligase [Planctomycetaceae bacterium]|nr:pantoate--beta-alanine ligase [Planctomycetaceae bacterium]
MTDLSVYDSIEACRSHLVPLRRAGRIIGLVPTMGALHAGHASLIRAARESCEVVVVWIFVNPTQFAPGEDFEKYPRPLERDLELCRQAGVDVVLAPAAEAMYPAGHQTHVEVREIALPWEGRHRPSHFRGVTTIVLKMFNIVQPDFAFFGQKDYQQQAIIRRMCLDLNVPVAIRTCETIRDPDGLALSSRNQYLSPPERQTALKLSAALREVVGLVSEGKIGLNAARAQMRKSLEAEPGIQLDYAEIVDADTLQSLESPRERMVAIVAATVGSTRLIDNMLIPPFSLAGLNDYD